MTVPMYTDVSKFRAPYKEAFLSGFGQDVAGPLVGFEQATEVDDKGWRYWKSEQRDAALANIEASGAVYQGSGAGIEVVALSPVAVPQIGKPAKQWIKEQWDAGKVVCASAGVVDPSLGVAQLIAVPKEMAGDIANTSAVAPVLKEPGLSKATMAVGAGIAVLVGLGLVLRGRKSRRATPNRRKRRRRRRR